MEIGGSCSAQLSTCETRARLLDLVWTLQSEKSKSGEAQKERES